MRKICAIITAAATALSLAGCANNANSASSEYLPTDIGGTGAALPSYSASTSAAVSGSSSAVSSVSSGSTSASSSASSGSTAASSASSGSAVSTAPSSAAYTATDIGGTGTKVPTNSFDGAGCAPVGMIKEEAFEADAVDAEYEYVSWVSSDEGMGCITDMPYDPAIPPPQAGLLTGGEWNDNAHWSEWVALYGKRDDWINYKNEWKIPYDCRIAVKVTAGGSPLEFAEVSCPTCPFKAVTDNNGMAYLFYTSIDGWTDKITVKYGSLGSKTIDGVLGNASVETDFDFAVDRKLALDFMIMCDTTGSMGDELEYLKAELESIVRKIRSDNSNIPVRTSINFYRDEGDEYVVRQYPFTSDIEQAAAAIQEQRAFGGGDFPEAVHKALDSAVNGHDWDGGSTKIMFLVLDAPPHSEDPQIVSEVIKHIEEAAAKGIRIIPIASSGIDKSTEYLLRVMAFATGGTYTFLTDHSGVGEAHLEPTVGAYNVEKLADMMVRIVNGYLGKTTASVPISQSGSSGNEQVTVIGIDDLTTPDMAFAAALEEIYHDGEYVYYFSCIMSDYFVVKYSDGTSEKLKPALASGRCKISDLDKYGIGYEKKAKAFVDIDE